MPICRSPSQTTTSIAETWARSTASAFSRASASLASSWASNIEIEPSAGAGKRGSLSCAPPTRLSGVSPSHGSPAGCPTVPGVAFTIAELVRLSFHSNDKTPQTHGVTSAGCDPTVASPQNSGIRPKGVPYQAETDQQRGGNARACQLDSGRWSVAGSSPLTIASLL